MTNAIVIPARMRESKVVGRFFLINVENRSGPFGRERFVVVVGALTLSSSACHGLH